MKLYHPLAGLGTLTQTFEQHVKRAIANGWCPNPGNCPSGIYYFGGIDWGIKTGTPVFAAQVGVVTTARNDNSGYGLHLRIQSEDGKYLLIYGHMSKLLVTVGDKVSVGQHISDSGNTGNSTGPHLHFEVRQGNTPIDPWPMLVTEIPEDPNDGAIVTNPPTSPVIPFGITRAGMNVRREPNINGKRAGFVPANTAVGFIRFVVEDKNLWGCIGGYPEGWVAIYFNENLFVELQKA